MFLCVCVLHCNAVGGQGLSRLWQLSVKSYVKVILDFKDHGVVMYMLECCVALPFVWYILAIGLPRP